MDYKNKYLKYKHKYLSGGNDYNSCNNLSDEEIFNIVFEEWSQDDYNDSLKIFYEEEILENSGILNDDNLKMQRINILINETKNAIVSQFQEENTKEKEEDFIRTYEMSNDYFIKYCKKKIFYLNKNLILDNEQLNKKCLYVFALIYYSYNIIYNLNEFKLLTFKKQVENFNKITEKLNLYSV
jgi:hypothetical protein